MRKGISIALVSAALVAGAVGLLKTRPWEHQATAAPSSASAGPAGGAARPPDVVVADAVKVKRASMDTTVPAVGTLVPNESVAIAPELSRRVVKVLASDGKKVKKGELLFKLDDADLGAQMGELTVRRKLAQDVEGRQKRLRAEGLSSEADYEKARSDVALIDAELGSLAVTVGRTHVKAPFAGTLGLRQVSEGAMVSPGTTLITLADDSVLKVDVLLPERYAPFVKVGAAFEFKVEGTEGAFKATVVAIEPTVLADTRSVKVRGVVDNAEGKLRPGAFVTVDFPLAKNDDAIMVPTVAIIPSLGGHGVYRATDGKVELVSVEIGVRTATAVEVTKGLAPGDLVLTTNLLRVRPGAPVKVGQVVE
jgi:membrane fusion protein (multidrug efflux system)